MIHTEACPAVSAWVARTVLTSGTDETALAVSGAQSERRQANTAAWQDIIDHRLVEWGRDPGELADDGLTPPTREIIRIACEVAQQLGSKGAAAPTRVAPTGMGGIVFERRTGAWFQSLEIRSDGAVELVIYEGSRLYERHRLR